MTERFTPEHVETWRRDGGLVIENFFTAQEVAAVQADFEAVWGRRERDGQALDIKQPGEIGRFNPKQFEGVGPVPLDCSPALNLIGAHPALIALAKALLGAENVYLYQCQAWAKFTGDADYDQPFHCDYPNHTLTAPGTDAGLNSVPILCYFSEVSEAHGPAHFVTRPNAERAGAPPEATLSTGGENARLQDALRPYERSSAGPAGSIFPYGIDIYHRGTNLTAPGGHRFALMACYRAASNDSVQFHAWPFHFRQPWQNIFNHATPEQLACFGVQPPGHPFWNETTLTRAQARYPGWDLTPYREAMAR
jgi:hypothetical protein